MKVLVTGATGFLGKYLVEELLNNGYEVIAQGRNEARLKELKETYSVETLCADLSEMADKQIETDFVIHAAALSTVWGRWDDFYNSNVEGTKNVIEFCKKNNVKKMVHVSSPSIYTEKADRYNISVDEVNKNNRLSFYIRTKIMAEDLVNKAFKDGLNTVIIRPRGLFGIGDTSIIPRLIKANRTIGIPLFNGGKNVVDITCVENVALALRLAIESGSDNGKTYNITNDEPTEFKSILESLFDKIGEETHYRKLPLGLVYFLATLLEGVYKLFHIYKEPSITRYTVLTLGYSQTLDIENAKNDLNYKPIMTLEEGIIKYANDLKSRKETE
ncbi:MAG: SDR family NAD(P)-dependent oxidoreductase [Lachnospiraceae bacterium]|nr:SDR family NAD(P)-dependent oxidoreductase [Lachnospiraceae bacterium]